MTYNKEQMQILAPFEKHFETAVNAGWCRYPGETALKTILDVYRSATGDNRNVRMSCGSCVLTLLKDAGAIYLKDKESMTTAPVKRGRPKTTKNGNKKN